MMFFVSWWPKAYTPVQGEICHWSRESFAHFNHSHKRAMLPHRESFLDLLLDSYDDGHLEALKFILSMASHKLNNSLLSAACLSGHFEVAKFLVENGLDPWINDDQCTPFISDANNGSLRILSISTQMDLVSLALSMECIPHCGCWMWPFGHCRLPRPKRSKREHLRWVQEDTILVEWNGQIPHRKGCWLQQSRFASWSHQIRDRETVLCLLDSLHFQFPVDLKKRVECFDTLLSHGFRDLFEVFCKREDNFKVDFSDTSSS